MKLEVGGSIIIVIIYTKSTEANLSVIVHRLFREDFPPLFRTIIDDFLTIFIQILVGFLDGSINPSLKHVSFTGLYSHKYDYSWNISNILGVNTHPLRAVSPHWRFQCILSSLC